MTTPTNLLISNLNAIEIKIICVYDIAVDCEGTLSV